MISIVVPVYNVASFVRNCLHSIADQTNKDFELIIVNDCSTDNSIEVVDKAVREFSLKATIVNHETNKGIAAASVVS